MKTTGATQISSDMMFGKADAPEATDYGTSYFENSANLEEYKEAATKAVSRVGERASQLKASAADWFS